MGKYVITAGELVCDSLYLNPLASFKKWNNTYEDENEGQKIIRLNNVILDQVKVKSIKYVALPDRDLNKLRGDVIMLNAVYVCDDEYDEILETIISRQ